MKRNSWLNMVLTTIIGIWIYKWVGQGKSKRILVHPLLLKKIQQQVDEVNRHWNAL